MMVTDAALCQACGKSAASQLVCDGCGVVQHTAREPDFFTVFGLPRRLVVDLADLERRYYALSRRLHPDVLHDRSPAEQSAGLRATALVTRAYRTLKDPVQRGLYWLSLHGESLGRNNERVPPALAAMVFEVQEQLESLRAARSDGDSRAIEREVEAVRRDLDAQLTAVRARLQDNFAATDHDGAGDARLTETKAVLSELHYLKTLVRDVDKELDPAWNVS
jgi:molecular chaperone HscB